MSGILSCSKASFVVAGGVSGDLIGIYDACLGGFMLSDKPFYVGISRVCMHRVLTARIEVYRGRLCANNLWLGENIIMYNMHVYEAKRKKKAR